MECWNYGKIGHKKKHCRTSKKKEENKGNVVNVVTEEIQDMLLMSVDSFIDSWVLDSRASFHTAAH